MDLNGSLILFEVLHTMDEELKSKRAELRRANQRYRKTKQRIRQSVKMLKGIGRLQRKLRREISELENERVSATMCHHLSSKADKTNMLWTSSLHLPFGGRQTCCGHTSSHLLATGPEPPTDYSLEKPL